jgi:capsular exopolysaccharide synthesis family protein
MTGNEEQSDPRAYLRAIRRRKGTILLVFVLVVGGVLGYSFSQPKKYTATAQVLIQANGAPPQFGTDTTSLQPNDVQTQVQLITSAPVKAAVAQSLGRGAPDVIVDSVGQTDVIDIGATSARPQDAAAIANAYAHSYVDVRRSQAVESFLSGARQVQAKIDDFNRQTAALNNQVTAAPPSEQSAIQQSVGPQISALSDQETALKSQLSQLQLSSAVQTGAAQVATPASVPTSPSSPRILRNGLVAAAVGLLLGTGLAFLRDYLDDSVRTRDDLERAGGGLPVLGMIPVVDVGRKNSATPLVSRIAPESPAAESYRSLRTSIQFLSVGHPIHRLQVTSATEEEGKTTTVANLGVALAAAGQRVTIVSCDLRRPRIHEFFGLSNEVGVTSILLGRHSVVEATQQVPGQNRLAVLPSGIVAPNPSELLQSSEMQALLQTLDAQSDIVLVDCPPVLPVTDATALSALVDATLVIASAEQTHAKALTRALKELAQVGAPVAGTVLNKVAMRDAYGYPSKYRYYADRTESAPHNGSGVAANGEARPIESGKQ